MKGNASLDGPKVAKPVRHGFGFHGILPDDQAERYSRE